MTRRAGLAIPIVLVLVALTWLAFWRPEPVGQDAAAGLAVATTGAGPAPSGSVAVESPAAAPRAPAAGAADGSAPSAARADPAPEPPAAETPDLAARDPLAIVVVDELGAPVFDAAVRAEGLRSAKDPGSYYEFRGQPATARTDAGGRATLDVWRWVDLDGRAISVDLHVTHAEYVPFRDDDFRVGPGEHRVTLRRGSVVSVRAWHGVPNRIVEDLQIDLEREAALGRSAWTRESDGRLVTTRIAPGRHLLRATHRPAQGQLLYSDVEEFELRPSERVDLVLELHAAVGLAGRLDDSVPRPVEAGRVMLSIQRTAGEGDRACLWSSHEADVRPDGTFTLEDLPRGSGYVFALARGHVSRRARVATLAEAGIRLAPGATPEDEERAWRDHGDLVLKLQRVEVPPPEPPFTIQMVETGSVGIAVTDLDGKPIADADVSVSPNVQIPGVGSILVPWREWSARTDALGTVRFEDLPPDPTLWFGAEAAGYRMREADRNDTPHVEVRPGVTARTTLALERAP